MQHLGKIASQSLSQSSETPQQVFEKAQYLEAAKMLLGCYRTGDANDPEVYITAAVRTLSAFPLEVVHRLIDPLTGLPGRSKWLPTVSEIREACQEIHGLNQRMEEWERGARAQVAERIQREAEKAKRPTLEQLREKHGATYGMDANLAKPLKDETDERRRVVRDRTAEYTRETMLREYRAVGIAPVYTDGILISPTLLRKLGKWPPHQRDGSAA
jgi:hypothetical protein